MQKSVTLPWESTVPYTSARIIISYYSSMPLNSRKRRRTDLVNFLTGLGTIQKTNPLLPTCYRSWNTVYVRLGSLAVSMRNSHRETLLSTCRRMLVVLALYPKFIKYHPRVRSRFILDSWVRVFLRVNLRKYMRLPFATLLKEASNSMVLIRSLTYGGRVTLSFTPSAKDLLVNLHLSVCTLINYSIPQNVSIRTAKQSSKYRGK